ncbi:hypothetical protein IWX90DRAFT_241283 [Phyllosticta citrichinensis]|uniref:Uncharacterized protein n=1 Tax=Phyllosticta citrichinensis TaxID=1130410 RepID=A0ABR1XQI3_9PEZI
MAARCPESQPHKFASLPKPANTTTSPQTVGEPTMQAAHFYFRRTYPPATTTSSLVICLQSACECCRQPGLLGARIAMLAYLTSASSRLAAKCPSRQRPDSLTATASFLRLMHRGAIAGVDDTATFCLGSKRRPAILIPPPFACAKETHKAKSPPSLSKNRHHHAAVSTCLFSFGAPSLLSLFVPLFLQASTFILPVLSPSPHHTWAIKSSARGGSWACRLHC